MTEQPKTQRRSLWGNLLKILVTLVGLAFVLLTKVDYGQVLEHLVGMDWFLYLGGLTLLLAGVFIRAYRWGTLLWALDVEVKWSRLVVLWFVGTFFGLFLPTGVGGDAVKMYEVARDGDKTAAAISSVLVDRFLGLFVALLLALLALIFVRDLVGPAERALIAAVFGLALLAVALLLQRTWLEALGRRLRLGRFLGRFGILVELYESLHAYGPRALLQATLVSLVFNLMLILANYLLGLAVGIEASIAYYFVFVPIISVLHMVPSIGGLGIREGGYKFLFSQVTDENRALTLGLAYLSTLIITGIIGAVLYIVQGAREASRT